MEGIRWLVRLDDLYDPLKVFDSMTLIMTKLLRHKTSHSVAFSLQNRMWMRQPSLRKVGSIPWINNISQNKTKQYFPIYYQMFGFLSTSLSESSKPREFFHLHTGLVCKLNRWLWNLTKIWTNHLAVKWICVSPLRELLFSSLGFCTPTSLFGRSCCMSLGELKLSPGT